MPLVDKTDKSSTRYKIEETYNELSSLGLTDEEIRDKKRIYTLPRK